MSISAVSWTVISSAFELRPIFSTCALQGELEEWRQLEMCFARQGKTPEPATRCLWLPPWWSTSAARMLTLLSKCLNWGWRWGQITDWSVVIWNADGVHSAFSSICRGMARILTIFCPILSTFHIRMVGWPIGFIAVCLWPCFYECCLLVCLLDRGEQHKSTLSPCFGHPATGAVRVSALACSWVSWWWCIEGELIVPGTHDTCTHTHRERDKHAWTHTQTNIQSQCTHHMQRTHPCQTLCSLFNLSTVPLSFGSLTDLVDHPVKY